MPDSINWSARRISRLAEALGARTYLEIGVARGGTFLSVTVPERTGVDPAFRFDTAAVADDLTHLVSATSDVFFAALPAAQTFDIVFLDGLHVAEQTYRDLCNALAHAHHDRHVVLDEHDRDAELVAQHADLALELARFAAVHAGRGLVEQEQLRAEHQRARDLEPPLRAVRQAARHVARVGAHS